MTLTKRLISLWRLGRLPVWHSASASYADLLLLSGRGRRSRDERWFVEVRANRLCRGRRRGSFGGYWALWPVNDCSKMLFPDDSQERSTADGFLQAADAKHASLAERRT